MATTFKKEFIANGLCAHVLKKPSGKNTYCYEIRYRSNGYDIRSSSTDLATAKAKFLEKTTAKEIEKYRTTKTDRTSFIGIFQEWYDYRSKTKVTKKVINTHKSHFYSLPKEIQIMPIQKITAKDIIACLARYDGRMYEEYRTLFNMLFTYASKHGIISFNPMGLIPFVKAERKSRKALTEKEIKAFFRRILEPEFDEIRQRAYIFYFFGLRASELDEETRKEGEFLITRNRKRKNGKIEYKKIPIHPLAYQYIDFSKPLYTKIRDVKANKLFHKLFGESKTAYNLRHTFATICRKSVSKDIVEIWLGDSQERLIDRHYTHFDDDFMLSNMRTVSFITTH